MRPIKILFTVALIIWSYYLIYSLYLGLIVNPIPEQGDGYDYHIPIAQTILDGRFLHPVSFKLPQWYYPGSGELINSLFILLNIPITVSNVVAVILLFIVCFRLALVFKQKYYFALLFALTIVTLNALVRWYNDMSLDVLVAVFFIYAIILLEQPQKKYMYFLKLGLIFGMLIGSKYSACLLVLLLCVVYGKRLLAYINVKRIAVFLIPFSFFGLFWYIRNYIYMQNPFYPIPIFGLPGKDLFQGFNVFNITLSYPLEMANAFYSEYNIWSLLIIVAVGFYIYKLLSSKLTIYGINRLYLLGIINFSLYFLFPTSYQPWIMVSSLRYSYPAFIPLILCVFLIASYYKKEEYLGYLSVGSMIMVLSMAYYPKLTPVYVLLAFLLKYFFDKYEKKLSN